MASQDTATDVVSDGTTEEIPRARLAARDTPTTGNSGSNGKTAVGQELALGLEGDQTLAFDDRELVLTEPPPKKASRVCGIFPSQTSSTPSKQTVPLYNVLWAELTDATLTIDFAQPTSKTKLRVVQWTLPVPASSLPGALSFAAALLAAAYGPARPHRRAKVLVNPHAGPGGAERKWSRDAAPILSAARWSLDVQLTTYSGEAADIAAGLDADAYDVVVACSGDGLPHEVFNGLGRRRDARRALGRLAVAHVPCGSGNAMSCNLYGTHRASHAALAIAKGVDTAMDLVSVTRAGGARTLSFLSQSLGIVAESDLATEHLRWMGGARFTYGYITRIFERRCYPCDLAIEVEAADKDAVKGRFAQSRAEEAMTADGNGAAKKEALDAEAESSTGSGDCEAEGLPELRFGTVDDPLPQGWELLPHDKMGNFYVGNMNYMAPDAHFFAAASIGDGCMDLVCIDGDVSPLTAIKLMLSVESGALFHHPLVSYRKVSAYRVVPREQKDGYISVDGERAPFGAFQAEVHRGLGRVISKSGRYEGPGPLGWQDH